MPFWKWVTKIGPYILNSNLKSKEFFINTLYNGLFDGRRIMTAPKYLLKLLKLQGLSTDSLDTIYLSLIVNRVLYGLPAWGGFLKETDISRVNKLFKRGRKNGYVNNTYDFHGLLNFHDKILFDKILTENHCLNHILPEDQGIKLRPRGHSFKLPKFKNVKYKHSFLIRTLYSLR